MKILFFDTHRYEKDVFRAANEAHGHDIVFAEARLGPETAGLAAGYDAVCSFVNDRVSAPVIRTLKDGGVRAIALRCAGFNHVDLQAAAAAGIPVLRVPAYSPHAVAEHALALLLTLNRKIHRAHARVRELNFSLDGLVFRGLGCQVLAHDLCPDSQFAATEGIRYVALEELLGASDIISLHVPLTRGTHHMIDAASLARLKPGVILVNTGRGALIDTHALIHALKKKQIGGACLDVYEEEEGIFFEDLSESGISDDQLARLLTFPNVLVTSHQAFLTAEALQQIAATTLSNLSSLEKTGVPVNQVESPSAG
ncbi:MAG: 2-hydroxyacid dehydrogenase [Gammaproteobacteria bacterium]|nr:2-hydroxyacid dehydrogenase [Gammaproteobacteria bacterium]